MIHMQLKTRAPGYWLVHIVVPPFRVAVPYSSLGNFSSSSIRGRVTHPIADFDHPLLCLLGTGIVSQEIAVSASFQQNLASICTSMFLDFFPRISISRVVSLCDFFIVSTSIFRSWLVLFNSFTCIVVFSCDSLRDFCVSFLRGSPGLSVFYCISFRELFMSSTSIMRYDLNPNLAFLVC